MIILEELIYTRTGQRMSCMHTTSVRHQCMCSAVELSSPGCPVGWDYAKSHVSSQLCNLRSVPACTSLPKKMQEAPVPPLVLGPVCLHYDGTYETFLPPILQDWKSCLFPWLMVVVHKNRRISWYRISVSCFSVCVKRTKAGCGLPCPFNISCGIRCCTKRCSLSSKEAPAVYRLNFVCTLSYRRVIGQLRWWRAAAWVTGSDWCRTREGHGAGWCLTNGDAWRRLVGPMVIIVSGVNN